MKLSELSTPAVSETDGEWMPFSDGVELLIAPMGNQSYDNEVQRLMRPLRKKRRNGRIKPDEMRDINMKACSKFILLGWKGITEDDGNTQREYTHEGGYAAFQKNYRFFKEVLTMAGGLDEEIVDFDEESESNLPSTSAGGSSGEDS